MNTTMLEAKGPDYVRAWPGAIAARHGRTTEQVKAAVRQVMGHDRIGDMTPQQARTVAGLVAEMPTETTLTADAQATAVADMLGLPAPTATGGCYYCGLPLNRRGQCEECV